MIIGGTLGPLLRVEFLHKTKFFFKSSPQKQFGQKSCNLYGIILRQCRFKFVKPWSPGVGLGHNVVGLNFYIEMYREKSIKILFLKYKSARKALTCVEASSGSVDASLFNWSWVHDPRGSVGPAWGRGEFLHTNLKRNISFRKSIKQKSCYLSVSILR